MVLRAGSAAVLAGVAGGRPSLAGSIGNISYLLPMVPALAILATAYGPLFFQADGAVDAGTAGRRVCGQGRSPPAAPWGLSFERGTVQADAAAASPGTASARAQRVIVVGMDDDLYASTLPLANCAMPGGRQPGRRAVWHGTSAGMGIILTARSSTASPNGNRYSGSACGSGDWIPANPSGRSF